MRAHSNSPLFDAYLIIDWSAANTPKRGKDSIWIGEARRNGDKIKSLAPVNAPTRTAAMALVEKRIAKSLLHAERLFIGFDFPFGYPAGAALTIAGLAHWDALWAFFHEAVDDDEKNRSNRYALAAAINAERFGAPVYWGRPHQRDIESLPLKKEASPWRDAHEFRLVEKAQPPAKSVWQLAYNGAVGSQAILGIARLETLRGKLGKHGAIWPFETNWDDRLAAPVTIAEIYPSMAPVKPRKDEVKDAVQVRTMARKFAVLDAKGAFRPLLARPDPMTDEENDKVIREEGWIVGAGRGIR